MASNGTPFTVHLGEGATFDLSNIRINAGSTGAIIRVGLHDCLKMTRPTMNALAPRANWTRTPATPAPTPMRRANPAPALMAQQLPTAPTTSVCRTTSTAQRRPRVVIQDQPVTPVTTSPRPLPVQRHRTNVMVSNETRNDAMEASKGKRKIEETMTPRNSVFTRLAGGKGCTNSGAIYNRNGRAIFVSTSMSAFVQGTSNTVATTSKSQSRRARRRITQQAKTTKVSSSSIRIRSKSIINLPTTNNFEPLREIREDGSIRRSLSPPKKSFIIKKWRKGCGS